VWRGRAADCDGESAIGDLEVRLTECGLGWRLEDLVLAHGRLTRSFSASAACDAASAWVCPVAHSRGMSGTTAMKVPSWVGVRTRR
jgi:hypothetical protein